MRDESYNARLIDGRDPRIDRGREKIVTTGKGVEDCYQGAVWRPFGKVNPSAGFMCGRRVRGRSPRP